MATSGLAISGGTSACANPAAAIATRHRVVCIDPMGTSSSKRVYRNGSAPKSDGGFGSLVGRTPWSAADPTVGLLAVHGWGTMGLPHAFGESSAVLGELTRYDVLPAAASAPL